MLTLSLALLTTRASAATFACDQVTITDPGTEVAVSGTLLWRRAQPTYISVENVDSGALVVERSRPMLYNDYDGGYWLDNYSLNTWRVGRSGTTSYYFLLDNGIIGTAFSAQLHLIFGPGGTWGWYPLELDCRITG
jgi:hypothetical protein